MDKEHHFPAGTLLLGLLWLMPLFAIVISGVGMDSADVMVGVFLVPLSSWLAIHEIRAILQGARAWRLAPETRTVGNALSAFVGVVVVVAAVLLLALGAMILYGSFSYARRMRTGF